MPPRFVAAPEPQAVIPQSTVLFRSLFEGTPPFMMKWFKDETELITGPSCMITLEKYSSTVELYSVGTLQSGIYSCQVSNEAGAVKSATELLVKGWTILFSSTTTTITTQLTPSLFSIFTAPLLHFCSLCLTTSSFRLLPGISVIFRVTFHPVQHPVTCPHPPYILLMLNCYFMLDNSNLIFFLTLQNLLSLS